MITPDAQAGLSDDEIDELGDFLARRAVPRGGMWISILDGYLTAVVSGPELIPPSEWFPQVWGDDAARDPEFENAEEALHFHGLVLRRMNEIIRTLDHDAIEPIFLEKKDATGATSDFADFWCLGYVQGIMLRKKAWTFLIEQDEREGGFLGPILTLASPFLAPDVDDGDDEDDEALNEFLASDEHGEITTLIPDAACEIYAFWKRQRQLPQTTIRRAGRPGRDDPCSCGSGKTYKICCAALS